jgi:hypothetical protein
MESWQKTRLGWFGGRKGGRRPELLVVILADRETPSAVLRGVAVAWAATLPPTHFVILDRFVDRSSIEPFLTASLETVELPVSRLLLVGVRESATIGLSIALGPDCPGFAGLLAYDPILDKTTVPVVQARLPRIRLVGRDGEGRAAADLFARTIRDLSTLGLDVRGTLLPEPGWTSAAIRIGASYLAELSASALDVPPRPGENHTRPNGRDDTGEQGA